MKLLTKSITNVLPGLYANEGFDNAKVRIRVKFFNPSGSGVWYATEYDPIEQMFFGFAEIIPGCGELGYFSFDELQTFKGQIGLGVERDLYFGTHYLKEVIDGQRP